MQACEAELHRREMSGVQRGRPGREAGAQGQHVLWVRKLSEVQVYFGAQADCGKMPELRQRISGREESEGGTCNRLPEQRVRLRAACAGRGGGYDKRVELCNWANGFGDCRL